MSDDPFKLSLDEKIDNTSPEDLLVISNDFVQNPDEGVNIVDIHEQKLLPESDQLHNAIRSVGK